MMIKTVINILLSSFLFLLSEISYAKDNIYQIYNNIESEISLRHWNSKSSGEAVSKVKITVIKAYDDHGDVVILSPNKNNNNFVTEVYKSIDIDEITSVWKFSNKKHSKTLTYQHGHFYMIQERITGKDGGVLSQVFKLP